jgi:hypothetical protein
MDVEKKLDALKKISKVDAPHFLFTRISRQISSFDQTLAPVQWIRAFAVTALIFILLNTVAVLRTSSASTSTGVEQVISTMHLSSYNNLYNE